MRRMVLTLTVVACACSGPSRDKSSDVTPSEVKVLFDAEPGAPAEEYDARQVTWRLFGVQLGDWKSAVFADTSDWKTREVAEGELLARNIRVLDLTDEGAELQLSSGASLHVGINQDLTVRRIQHAVDHAVEYLGRGRYKVEPAQAQAVLRAHGLGGQAEPVMLHDLSLLKVTEVQPRGAVAMLGFETGDLLRNVDALAPLVERIAQGERVELEVLRRGVPLQLTYAP